jgi:hypothetical protein
MKKKNTLFWFVLAAGLFASIYFLDHYLRPPIVAVRNVLRGLRTDAITSLQVIPAGALEIRAERVNNAWMLVKPLVYPAQPAAIEALLAALQKLTPATRIEAAEFQEHHSADTNFGFDMPQVSLVLEAGEQRWQVLIGNRTAPGDQVFVRVVGVPGAFVTGVDWLKLVPRSGTDWRSTALVAADAVTCDGIVLTNGTKVIELRRDATNHLWRMLRPLQARADTGRITEALQRLQTASITQFVTDNPKADLTTYGLQPADLSLWLNRGTNFISAVQTGSVVTNDAAQVYLKRERWSVIGATAKEPLTPWRGSVNDFRDPFLLELTVPVTEIEIHTKTNFTLKQLGTNQWSVGGEKFPADTERVESFLKLLAGLRVSEFVKDVVTAPDLSAYGLETPQYEITLRSAAGDSNTVLAQMGFAVQTNGVFVHRADEDFIYAIAPDGFKRLPEAGWEFRERRIWNFSENDVASITLHQGGRTRVLLHDGQNKWSLGPGSEGIVNPFELEETAHRLGGLTATGWVGRNVTEPEKYGLNPENLEITVELKSGEKLSVNFGLEISNQTALAAVMLDGERWAFVFPATLYQFVLSYLTIPTNTR